MKLKIKVGDEVKIIAGSDKGRKGSVLEINFIKSKIRVKDVRVQTIFNKKDSKIEKREGFIDYSNVSLVQAASKKDKQDKQSSNKKSGGFFSKK